MEKRILIADDDAGIRDIIELILGKAGFIIDLKSSGEDILQNKFTIPDLFLLDKQLADTSGVDICKYLKSSWVTKHVPIILISGSPDIAMLYRGAGADDFIEKPFELDQLLAIINKYLA